MGTTIRAAWLGLLGRLGVRRFVANSGLGHPFMCHLGDFLGENPFYNREAFRVELELCAAWLRLEQRPVVFDVGANVGFWATQLAQMLAPAAVQIYAFEPVPATFAKLLQSVDRLNLGDRIHAIAAAVREDGRPVRLSYRPRDSLFAQVAGSALNRRAGDRFVHAAGLALDRFCDAFGVAPTFVKIDVEGSEVSCLRGARRLLAGADRPTMIFEYNPLTLSETMSDASALRDLLAGYTLYYVDDFEGQRRPVGEAIPCTHDLVWPCNLFAVPSTADATARWSRALEMAKRKLKL